MKANAEIRNRLIVSSCEKISFDQLKYINEFISDERKDIIKVLCNSLYNGYDIDDSYEDLLKNLMQLNDKELIGIIVIILVHEYLSKLLYSNTLSLGILKSKIGVEESVELSLGEENYQKNIWGKIPEYHSLKVLILVIKKEIDLKSNIYYSKLFLKYNI